MPISLLLKNLGVSLFIIINNPKIRSNFLVVETIPNFNTKVVPMTRELFNKGFKEFTHLLKLVAFYCMHGYEGFGVTQET